MVVLALFILGLCFGSFINAFVWRIKKRKDWVRGRSVCINCGHKLAGKDLIPIFSWILLTGKCRYCHKPISWQYPAVELLTVVLFVFSYIYWPVVFDTVGVIQLCFWLVFLIGLISLAIYDIKWMLLPNKIMFPMIWLGLSQAVFLVIAEQSSGKVALQILASVLVGFGIFYILFQISSGRWIGGGDVKLGGLLALILAAPSLMALTIFISSLLGTLYSLPLLATGKVKKTSKIPYGPFLIIGAIIAKLFGESIIRWYQNKFLYL